MRKLLLLLLLSPTVAKAEITPAEYRSQVVDYSLDLKKAQTVSYGAAEGVRLAYTSFLPSLSMEGNFKFHLHDLDWQDRWNYDLQPKIVQSIYGGGALRAAYDAAQDEAAIALCSEEFTMLEVCYAADYAYWNLIAMELYNQTMGEYVEIIRSLQEAIKLRFEDGYTAKGDLLMISSRLSEAEYESLSAAQSYAVALHNFNTLRGFDDMAEVVTTKIKADTISPPHRVEREELLARRPDFMAATITAELAEADIRLARSNYNPKLSGIAYGYASREAAALGGDSYINGTLQLQLTVPIFNFGARHRSVAIARATEQIRQLEIQSTSDAIYLEESNGWTGIIESHAQLAASRRALEIASENLEISTYSYREGLTTIVDVMQAQLSWIQIYTNSINAELDYLVAISAYERIVGRNFMDK